MTRDYAAEVQARVQWIKDVLAAARCEGVVFGSSGGKDSVLVGILCRRATNNTLGIIMPCNSLEEDTAHALLLADKFNIEHITVDLVEAKEALVGAIPPIGPLDTVNIAPRLRMATLYAIANGRKALVAGTGNRSEGHMGYFTKWGDGAYDFNPIADLTVTEVYEFLKYLEVPEVLTAKAPSAGLFEGQTDEDEMGITYAEIDNYLLTGQKGPNFGIIEQFHERSEHKRKPIVKYGG